MAIKRMSDNAVMMRLANKFAHAWNYACSKYRDVLNRMDALAKWMKRSAGVRKLVDELVARGRRGLVARAYELGFPPSFGMPASLLCA